MAMRNYSGIQMWYIHIDISQIIKIEKGPNGYRKVTSFWKYYWTSPSSKHDYEGEGIDWMQFEKWIRKRNWMRIDNKFKPLKILGKI